MAILKRKIRVMFLLKNGDLVFSKKAYEGNKIKTNWGDVEFEWKNVFTRTPKIYGVFPILFLRKNYVVVREGDLESLGLGELPRINTSDILECAKTELLRRLGLDVPKDRSAIQILILLGVMFVAFLELLRLAGVRVG